MGKKHGSEQPTTLRRNDEAPVVSVGYTGAQTWRVAQGTQNELRAPQRAAAARTRESKRKRVTQATLTPSVAARLNRTPVSGCQIVGVTRLSSMACVKYQVFRAQRYLYAPGSSDPTRGHKKVLSDIFQSCVGCPRWLSDSDYNELLAWRKLGRDLCVLDCDGDAECDTKEEGEGENNG